MDGPALPRKRKMQAQSETTGDWRSDLTTSGHQPVKINNLFSFYISSLICLIDTKTIFTKTTPRSLRPTAVSETGETEAVYHSSTQTYIF